MEITSQSYIALHTYSYTYRSSDQYGSPPYPPRGSTLLHKEAPPTEGLTAQDQRLRWEGQEGYLEVARAKGLRYLKGKSAGGVTSS